MATLEARVMRACHVMLVNATKTCCTSVAGDLFQEYLITEDVKTAMSLNIPDQDKAEKLVDSVRAQVAGTPEKINVFIKVLGRNSMEDTVKKLEEQILLFKEKETNAIDQPRVEVKSKPKKETDAIDIPGAEAQSQISLPNKLNFPHLKTDGLTENERVDLLTKLMEDYDTICQEFACLVHSTLKSLKSQNTTLEELEVAVKTYLPQSRVHTLFSGTKSLNEMFLDDLFEYWSFFDYELLEFIIKNQCKELQADLNEYIKVFKEYCKRRFSEVPKDFNSKTGRRFVYKLVVKIKEEFDHITMEQVKEVECQLRNMTSLDLSLSRVGDGCIELTFISLSGELPLSAHDKEELYEMGVLKLYSANCVYYDRCESSPSDGGAQERLDLTNTPKSMQNLHENLFCTDSQLLMEMKSELESLRSSYHQSLEEKSQEIAHLKMKLEQENDGSSPSGAQICPPLPNPNFSQQEIKLITDAVKESDKVGDLAAALDMSDCLDAGGDVEVLLQQWQEKVDPSNFIKRAHLLLYHIARIGMQDLHENLVTQETQLLIDMQSELDSLRSENEQLKDELQQEDDESQEEDDELQQEDDESQEEDDELQQEEYLPASQEKKIQISLSTTDMCQIKKRKLPPLLSFPSPFLSRTRSRTREESLWKEVRQDRRSSRSTGEEKQKMQGHEDSKAQESQVTSIQGDEVSQGFSRPRTRPTVYKKQLMESHKAPLSLKRQKIQDTVQGDKDFRIRPGTD